MCEASRPRNTGSIARLCGVSKIYGDRVILGHVELELNAGEIALVSGANGVGKSTLLRLLAGLCRPTSGEIYFNGEPRIAYLGHATFLYPGLTALENLKFWARIGKVDSSEKHLLKLLEKMGLETFAHDAARVFSRGMAQKLNFARVLMLESDLMLLDEPLTGMDAESRELMRAELKASRQRGASIVMVSHDIETDARLADRLFTVANGCVTQTPSPGVPAAKNIRMA